MKRNLFLVAMLARLAFPTIVLPQEQQSSSTGMGQAPAGVDGQGIKNYLLGPGDMLDVRVFGQPDLNSTVEIDSDGNISSLPFLDAQSPHDAAMKRKCKETLPKPTRSTSRMLR